MTVRYKNEAMFSKALCAYLKKCGWFIQRIESGATGKGIPDVYAINLRGESVWIELKRHHQAVDKMSTVTLAWRPGQQAWLHEVTKRGAKAYTVVAADNKYLVINHKEIYKGDSLWVGNAGNCLIYDSMQEAAAMMARG